MTRGLPACRSCGAHELELVLSLGRTPLANALLTREQLTQPEPLYPLDLAFCPSCTLVQITETVPPADLFSEYLYFSSFSDTMLRHAQSLVLSLIAERRLGPRSLVVEVASNDGYLLQYYQQAGVPVLGIEPAANIASEAKKRGVPTIVEFFGQELAGQLRAKGQRADVIHVHNVLAHVADLNGFVEGIKVLLKDDGVAVIEAPYVKDLIDHCEFDTIYHEHLCYYSLTALDRLFRRHDLFIQDVDRISIHGGSLRVTVGKSAQPALPQRGKEHVAQLLAEETAWGVGRFATYRHFGARVEALKATLTSMLAGFKRRGDRIAAYGAAAKGSTLLNYFGIGLETLDFVVDRSPHKQGRFMPGVHIPIRAPERLLEEMPDEVLLLTWNFADEILEQQKAYRQLGGRFIIPVPEVRVVADEEVAA
ncbi:MAG TPA: class I SAM-dependent methyltransferase [Candidatus Dormibacteraeota bacterium]|nr:class I SAM-dependent methyltransferase [Candidatus Dormibacteraeota bacterium]